MYDVQFQFVFIGTETSLKVFKIFYIYILMILQQLNKDKVHHKVLSFTV